MFRLTIKEFADHYIPSNSKVAVILNANRIFEGTLEELYYIGERDVLRKIVTMVSASEDGYLCLSCR